MIVDLYGVARREVGQRQGVSTSFLVGSCAPALVLAVIVDVGGGSGGGGDDGETARNKARVPRSR